MHLSKIVEAGFKATRLYWDREHMIPLLSTVVDTIQQYGYDVKVRERVKGVKGEK